MANGQSKNWQNNKVASPGPANQSAPVGWSNKTEEFRDGSFINVWKNLWSLIVSPSKMAARVKNQRKIGWLYGNIAIIYVIFVLLVFFLQWSMAKIFQAPIGGPEAAAMNPFSLIVSAMGMSSFATMSGIALVLYAIFAVITVSAGWAVITMIIHFFATIYGGRQPYWIMGVFNFYMFLLSVAVLLVLMIIMLLSVLTAIPWLLIIYFVLAIAAAVWFIILYAKGIKEHYELSTGKSVLTILSPVIIWFIIMGIIVGLTWVSKDKFVTGKRSGTDFDMIFDKFNQENKGANSLVNNSLNQQTAEAEKPIISLPLERISAMTKETLKEIAKYKNLEVKDRTRIYDLIRIKYFLDYYYETNGKYPISNLQEKIDGQSDSLTLGLKDYYGSKYLGIKDAESPTYYYTYTSDGKNYELTAYLTGPKEIYKLTNNN